VVEADFAEPGLAGGAEHNGESIGEDAKVADDVGRERHLDGLLLDVVGLDVEDGAEGGDVDVIGEGDLVADAGQLVAVDFDLGFFEAFDFELGVARGDGEDVEVFGAADDGEVLGAGLAFADLAEGDGDGLEHDAGAYVYAEVELDGDVVDGGVVGGDVDVLDFLAAAAAGVVGDVDGA